MVVGSPNSGCVVASPFVHFQISLSLPLSVLFLIRTLFFSAVRHTDALAGHEPVKHTSLFSSQL